MSAIRSSRQIAGANPAWSYGLSLAQTLFNGGLTDAQVAAARAAYEASVATYRQTVLTAFQQVEDNLVAIRVFGQEAKVRPRRSRRAEQAVQIAHQRISRRHAEFHDRRDRRRRRRSTDEESLLATRAQRLPAAVTLIVALGGGWNDASCRFRYVSRRREPPPVTPL